MNKAVNDDFVEMTAQITKFKHVYLSVDSNVELGFSYGTIIVSYYFFCLL